MPQIDMTARHSDSVGPPGPAQTKVLDQAKHAARTTWALGDYAAIAARELWPLGQRIVARAGIRPGEDVLDVGCGTGNAAIRAAGAGGRVVGLDLTPELLETGRRLAAEAGVDVEWVEGDAEALPFDEESFDVVVSVLGVMFAPRHQVAANELVRVLRPGGRLILCNWAHDGVMSRIFGAVARFLPPPPPFAAPPAHWGAEDHVRDLFAGMPIDLEFERGVHEFPPFDSAEVNIEFHTTRFGPLMAARALTGAEGRWPALHTELLALHEAFIAAEYLVVLGAAHFPLTRCRPTSSTPPASPPSTAGDCSTAWWPPGARPSPRTRWTSVRSRPRERLGRPATPRSPTAHGAPCSTSC